jgi:acyl carrier protein
MPADVLTAKYYNAKVLQDNAKVLQEKSSLADSLGIRELTMDGKVHAKETTQFEVIAEFVKTYLKDELMVESTVEDMGLEQGLQVDLGLDSIAFLELRTACEEKYNIEITDDEFSPENFSSIRGVVNLILAKL